RGRCWRRAPSSLTLCLLHQRRESAGDRRRDNDLRQGMTLSKGPATINIANSPADRSPREGIVEAIIAEATEAAHRRVTPHSVDWSSVSPARVARIFSALSGRNVAPPRALMDALLLAGHTVPADFTRSLEQRALNDLNRATAVPAILAADISRLAEHEHIAPEIAGAIVRRLA